ncbi:FG-GAP-like repeat-containing protein [Leptospira ellisii]|uniref:FG-GAP-like repeat-containing protein n=3 Tax=Leptospira ellisii TaxID=2023197 RepID=A0AAE4QJK6_9LEPT|nr:FG-GAP-like repeat-containing protein [Leptospira ellisii]MDV6234160.1 FG-GAP-like repeat-containing protein [Leptospira ellisii]
MRCLLGQNEGCSPVPTVRNVRNLGTIRSGFLIGNVFSFDQEVQVSLDEGPFQKASVTGGRWSFALPTGSSAWKYHSLHSIGVRTASSGTNTILVRKGNNEDVNGDGYPDLLVGANQFGGSANGKAYLFYGGEQGIVSQSAASSNAGLVGLAAGDQAGWSLALGDFNGDGYADAAVGAPTSPSVYIYHSAGANGISSSDSPARTLLGLVSSFFGGALGTGDVNGDGYEDLFVGAYGANSSQGAVYIFHSTGSSGIVASGYSTATTTLVGELSNDRFGMSLSVGDANGDGYADVLVGADGISKAYVFHSTGVGGIPANSAPFANTLLYGPTATQFGISVALGDVTGDGFDDASIGAKTFSTGTGRAFFFHSVGITGIANQDFSTSGVANSTITGSISGGLFGSSISLGDVNGDGFADALIGAPATTTGNGFVALSLGVFGVPTLDLSSSSANSILIGENTNDQFGNFISRGDPNGDGYEDVFIGAYGYPAATNQGKLYGFTGGPTGILGSAASSAPMVLTGEAGASQFGYSTAFQNDPLRGRNLGNVSIFFRILTE